MSDNTGIERRGDDEVVSHEMRSAAVAIESDRAMQEVQAQATLARRFPRNERQVFVDVIEACKRRSLAEVSQYEFPRGDSKVTGPSIRLAECVMQKWQHTLAGWKELERRRGQSVILAYAWDLQANVRKELQFVVSHVRETKKGNYPITGERDIYEVCANQAQRRVRSCILALIPRDLVDAAIEQCDKTMKDGKEPLAQRVEKMAASFAEYGVLLPMIEKRLGHRIETVSETEVVSLRRIYTAIKDNMADPWAYFERDPEAKPDSADAPAGGTTSAPRGKRGAQALKDMMGPTPGAAAVAEVKKVIDKGEALAQVLKEIDAIMDDAGAKDPAGAKAAWALALQDTKPHTTIAEDMTPEEAVRLLGNITKRLKIVE